MNLNPQSNWLNVICKINNKLFVLIRSSKIQLLFLMFTEKYTQERILINGVCVCVCVRTSMCGKGETDVSMWIGRSSPQLDVMTGIWIRTWGLIVEDRKGSEAVCVHLDTKNKARVQWKNVAAQINDLEASAVFSPAMSKACAFCLPGRSSSLPLASSLCVRSRAPSARRRAARGQAKQHCSVQRTFRKNRATTVSCQYLLCQAHALAVWRGGGGCRVMPICAPSTSTQQQPGELCSVASFIIFGVCYFPVRKWFQSTVDIYY